MFTIEDVKKIAKLSRLHITEEETEQYREKLGSILEYVQQLQIVDTTGIPEFQHAVVMENVFRSDEPRCDPDERERAMKMFSARKGDLLEVQAVISRDE